MTLSDSFRTNLSKLAAKGSVALGVLRDAEPSPYPRGETVSLNLAEVDVVYLLGVGDGASYAALKEWLHAAPGRFLVYLECDFGALRAAMEGEELTELLDDPLVKLYLYQEGKKGELLLSWCYTYFSAMHAAFAALPSYAKRYPNLAAKLERSIGAQSYDTTVILQELFTGCAGSFANLYPNLLRLPYSYHGNKLFGRFQGVPAIICGAGPSLEKSVEVLKELRDRALIIAPGSTMNALGSYGIVPHFGCATDPNIDQLDRFERNDLLEVPIFYSNRWHRSILPFWHGPNLFVHGLTTHVIEEEVEERLGLVGGEPLEPGHSATHICLELARMLGCGPIALVGQDLAYSEGKLYSDRVGASSGMRAQDLVEGTHYYERPISVESVTGKTVETAWKWVVEARWIAQWAERHRECGLINATEGGLGIEGIPHLSLAEVAADWLHSRPLQEWVAREIHDAKIEGVTRRQMIDLLRPLYDSLGRSLPIVSQLVTELERLEQAGGDRLRSGRAALLESDFFDEVAYRHLFERILTLCSATLCRQLEQWRNLPSEEQVRERLRFDCRKYTFVKEGIEVQRQLLKGAMEL